MFTTLVYIISIIGITILSLFVISRREERAGLHFSLMSIALGLMLLFQFGATQYDQYSEVILTIGLVLFSFVPFFLFQFVYFFSSEDLKTKTNVQQIIAFMLLIIMVVSGLLPSAIISTEVKEGALVISTGWPYLIQSLAALILALYSFTLLGIRYGSFSSSKKKAARAFIYGISIAAFGNLLSGLIFADVSTVQFTGPLSVFIMSVFVTYAITKHHLLDIKSAVVRSVAYILSTSILIAIYFMFTSYISSQFSDETIRQIVTAFLFIAFIAIQRPLKKRMDQITNFIFYRDTYNTEGTLTELGRILAEQAKLEDIANKTNGLLADSLMPSYCSIYVLDETGNVYKYFTQAKKVRIGEKKLSMFSNDKIVVRDRLKAGQQKTFMSENNIDVICVLRASEKNVGYIVLGPKLSGDIYSKQDMSFLQIAVRQLAIAIQNARYYNEIAEFNETLQEKIKKATEKLEKTNAKLKELDSAKDEFISMASHQLRTPLTTVKGYLSMVLEGDAGKLNKEQHQFIDQAFGSAQRMVYLIADLLNVSRLNTGKFVIDPIQTNLARVVQEEIDQLQRHAKTRKINLKYEQPKAFPDTMLDETKVRQVIMNFTDNAIYYTKEGGDVTVELKETKESIEFTVTDTGIGVPKELQPKLFNKFYRADNAKQQRPDGTGLGLFMAKKVIVASGGATIFKSKEGVGSTFGFTFPKKDILAKK